jgi:hypothetical protein
MPWTSSQLPTFGAMPGREVSDQNQTRKSNPAIVISMTNELVRQLIGFVGTFAHTPFGEAFQAAFAAVLGDAAGKSLIRYLERLMS